MMSLSLYTCIVDRQRQRFLRSQRLPLLRAPSLVLALPPPHSAYVALDAHILVRLSRLFSRHSINVTPLPVCSFSRGGEKGESQGRGQDDGGPHRLS